MSLCPVLRRYVCRRSRRRPGEQEGEAVGLSLRVAVGVMGTVVVAWPRLHCVGRAVQAAAGLSLSRSMWGWPPPGVAFAPREVVGITALPLSYTRKPPGQRRRRGRRRTPLPSPPPTTHTHVEELDFISSAKGSLGGAGAWSRS